MREQPLGPMPTTRRGRFEFYRKRALRRLRKIHRRIGTVDGLHKPCGAQPTSRRVDLDGMTKQMPRTYPLVPIAHDPPLPPNAWRVKPRRGVWGVPLNTNPWWWLPHVVKNKPRHAQRGYMCRRVKSVPRLKHLGRLPWVHSILDVLDHDHYPSQYPTYPSGAANPWYVPE